MHFIKHRFNHGRHIGRRWWAVIYGAWSILCSADVVVGKYGSDQFKTAWDAAWKLPKFGWKVWLIGMLAITVLMIFEGSYQHSRKLEEMLFPRLKIPEIAYEQPYSTGSMTHYIDVVNESEGKTVTEVKVNLREMNPPPKVAKWLPMPLHIKHDNKQILDRQCNINAGDKIQIDLVSAPRNAAFFAIVDIVAGPTSDHWTTIYWTDVPSGVCELTVTASGMDVVQAKRTFYVYQDTAGYLRCSPRPLSVACTQDARIAKA